MQSINSFEDVNNYLESLYKNIRVDSARNNTKAIMEYLGNPQDKYKSVHIAGTSGKTSTAYFMASLLKESGKKVGLYISPYVDHINERIQIDLEPIAKTEFTVEFTRYLNLLSNLEFQPSTFELLTSFMYWYLAEQRVDYAVIEVRMGGLNDVTNVIKRSDKLCLITDIGLDHMNYLGGTLSEIASHKVGIVLRENKVIMHEQPDEIMEVITKHVKNVRANLEIIKIQDVNTDKNMADYQFRNWSLAHAGYRYLKKRDNLESLNKTSIDNTKHVKIPARMEIKHIKKQTIIIDSAHNVQKMSAFIYSFKKLYPGVRPKVLIAVKNDKDYKKLADIISSVSSSVIVTSFKSYAGTPISATDPHELAQAFDGNSTEVIVDPIEAFNSLIDSTDSVLIITGSIYLISQLRAEFSSLK